MATNNVSKKRKFVADGLFYAELNEFLQGELGEDGYAGVEVRVTPVRTEIIIRATRTQMVLGEKGRRIRELTSLVQKRFLFPEGNVELYAERVQNRALSAIAQAESLKFKLLGGLAVRRACYGVMRYVMENGAKVRGTRSTHAQCRKFFCVWPSAWRRVICRVLLLTVCVLFLCRCSLRDP
jgi:small subunit ribosomal protein S3e